MSDAVMEDDVPSEAALLTETVLQLLDEKIACTERLITLAGEQDGLRIAVRAYLDLVQAIPPRSWNEEQALDQLRDLVPREEQGCGQRR